MIKNQEGSGRQYVWSSGKAHGAYSDFNLVLDELFSPSFLAKNVHGILLTPTSPSFHLTLCPAVHSAYHLAREQPNDRQVMRQMMLPEGRYVVDVRVGGVHEVVSVPWDMFLDNNFRSNCSRGERTWAMAI